MTKMTGAEAIIKSLRVNEVDTVFALPGGQLDYLFDAMYRNKDKHGIGQLAKIRQVVVTF